MNDFGYGVTNNADNADVTKDNNGNAVDLSKSNGLSSPDDNDSTTDLDKNKNNDNNDVDNNIDNNNNDNNDNDNNDKSKSEFVIEPGTVLDIDDKKYTIDDNGNIVDENGNIFKEAKDVKDFIDSFTVNDDNSENEISIDNIRKLFDVEVVDENDKPIEFENTPNGIKSYIDAVINNKEEEIAENAINTLYDKFLFLEI